MKKINDQCPIGCEFLYKWTEQCALILQYTLKISYNSSNNWGGKNIHIKMVVIVANTMSKYSISTIFVLLIIKYIFFSINVMAKVKQFISFSSFFHLSKIDLNVKKQIEFNQLNDFRLDFKLKVPVWSVTVFQTW